MVINEELNRESKEQFYASLPKLVVYLLVIFAIWLFAIVIFGPLGTGIFIASIEAATVVTWIAIIAILILLAFIVREIVAIANAIGGFIAARSSTDSPQGLKNIQQAVRYIIYVIIVAIIFIFFRALILSVSNSPTSQTILGVVLIVIAIWVIWLLYRAGMDASEEIGKYAVKLTETAETQARAASASISERTSKKAAAKQAEEKKE